MITITGNINLSQHPISGRLSASSVTRGLVTDDFFEYYPLVKNILYETWQNFIRNHLS